LFGFVLVSARTLEMFLEICGAARGNVGCANVLLRQIRVCIEPLSCNVVPSRLLPTATIGGHSPPYKKGHALERRAGCARRTMTIAKSSFFFMGYLVG